MSLNWILPPAAGLGLWEIKARPTFPEALLALYRQGKNRIAAGDFVAGAQHWRSAVEAADQRNAPLLAAWLQDQLAQELENTGRSTEADAVWERAVQRLEGSQPAAAAQLLRDWSTSLERRNLWDLVEVCYRRALALEQAESLTAAWDLGTLGSIASRRGDLSVAEDLFLKGYSIVEKLAPESPVLGMALNSLGNIAEARSDLSIAEERFRQALKLFERLEPNGTNFAQTLTNLGTVNMN
ncbi:MAG TPA: tetratricopeptide repeat protein, partial [Thermoanaerobaculia bacterium]|nr:tetratricopeptide repeat protein [Thermoanaerobaculia bacterium]